MENLAQGRGVGGGGVADTKRGSGKAPLSPPRDIFHQGPPALPRTLLQKLLVKTASGFSLGALYATGRGPRLGLSLGVDATCPPRPLG